jgi:hypothetical protein
VNGDDHAAINVWRGVFGESFPEAPTKSEEAAFAASLTGGVTSTGHATSSRTARHRSPRTRAFGGERE